MGFSPKKRAYYSEEFKRAVVSRVERGELSVVEAGRQYQISGSMTIYRWLLRYGSEAPADGGMSTEQSESMKKEPSSKSREELAAEVQALKRLLELERLRSEAYLEMIKLAEGRYGIPIEKKSGAKQSGR